MVKAVQSNSEEFREVLESFTGFQVTVRKFGRVSQGSFDFQVSNGEVCEVYEALQGVSIRFSVFQKAPHRRVLG